MIYFKKNFDNFFTKRILIKNKNLFKFTSLWNF